VCFDARLAEALRSASWNPAAMDWNRKIQTVFSVLITLQFFVVASHDLVNISGLAHGAQVQAVVGRRKLWLATLINSTFPGLAVAFAIYFWNQPRPWFVVDYWVLYCGVSLVFAVAMWYVPYFFGTTVERKLDYARMYEGTRQVLPARGDNPRPNLLHVCFHVLFVINFLLVLVLRLRSL
jgi:hypothetical protein